MIVSPTLAQANSDGTFVLENIAPTEYRLAISGLPPGFYVKDARLGGADVLGKEFPIASSVSGGFNIVVSPSSGEVSGAVQDDRQQPVAEALVALVPDRQRDRSDLYKSATTDASGRFTVRGITPGDYKLFAWEDLARGGYFEPGLLQKVE